VIIGIHQPAYLPWLGYFDRIRSVDLFIFLVTVQFQKGSFQNRNKVMTQTGSKWLTIPVETAGKFYDTTLKDLRVDNKQRWQSKHWSTLKMNYGSAPAFDSISGEIKGFYYETWAFLADLCWEMLLVFNRLLGLKTPMIKASELGEIDGQKSDLVLNLCREVGAHTYLSGSQGRNYLNEPSFAASGIKVEYQNFSPIPYHQRSETFVPTLGIVDFLFNETEPVKTFTRMQS